MFQKYQRLIQMLNLKLHVKKKIDGKNTKTGHYRFWSTVG